MIIYTLQSLWNLKSRVFRYYLKYKTYILVIRNIKIYTEVMINRVAMK